jgi:hypothetical protein
LRHDCAERSAAERFNRILEISLAALIGIVLDVGGLGRRIDMGAKHSWNRSKNLLDGMRGAMRAVGVPEKHGRGFARHPNLSRHH